MIASASRDSLALKGRLNVIGQRTDGFKIFVVLFIQSYLQLVLHILVRSNSQLAHSIQRSASMLNAVRAFVMVNVSDL